jgi:hypothetical protein
MGNDTPTARMAAALHVLADSSEKLRAIAEAFSGTDKAHAVRLVAEAGPELKAAIGGLTMLDGTMDAVETGMAMLGCARQAAAAAKISRAQTQLKSFLARGGVTQ